MNLLSRRAAFSTLTIASGTAAAYSIYHHKHTNAPTKKMLPSYEATFSVPLECDACITDIKGALSKVDGPPSLFSPHFLHKANNPPHQASPPQTSPSPPASSP